MAKKQEINALDALLAADLTIEKDVFIKRLGTHIKVKALDGKTLAKIRERATFGGTLDENLFGALLIEKACVNVNFNDSRLLEKYGASDGADAVQKALLAGEIALLTEAIFDISGFGYDEEAIEEVKN
jgi:Phage XkdN-like tail assembly chaperone protein, TAC